ncbi:MAG: ATP-binding protein, partial [Verrucomicrobiota bacterium]
ESLPHLFERFYRVDKSRARSQEQGGFGLGLAICDTIVKAHGGAIEVESRPGVETRFVIRLPRNGDPEAPA